jgi:hypothetical protein
MPAFVYALMLHGVLGGIDIILNHELLARLPARPEAAPEERLHSMREVIFAAAFMSLAWFEWRGQLAWWIAVLFVGELLVSMRDAVVEGETRVLPVSERVLHVLLFVNLGVVMTLVAYRLGWWYAAQTELVRADYGWASWVLTVFSVGSLAWAVRDGLAAAKWRAAARRSREGGNLY